MSDQHYTRPDLLDAHALCHYIAVLGRQPHPRAEDVMWVSQLLQHKWHGVQVVAARALSAWRFSSAVPLLRVWLTQHLKNHQMRRQAQRALALCVTELDLPWIIDLYSANRSAQLLFLIAVLVRFPRADVAERIAADVRAGYPDSVVLLARVPFPNRETLLDMLAGTPNIPNRDLIERCRTWEPVTLAQTIIAS